jgi:tetratricopeptide (TPR) repeat protein
LLAVASEAKAYNNRGLAYVAKSEYDLAIADCTQAIRLDPKLSAAFKCRGAAYFAKNEYDRAIAAYTDAKVLSPTDMQVLYLRVNVSVAIDPKATLLDHRIALRANNAKATGQR